MQQRLREYETAQDIRAAMQDAGINPRNKSDVVNFITGGTPDQLGGVIGRAPGKPLDVNADGPSDPFGDMGNITLQGDSGRHQQEQGRAFDRGGYGR